MNIYIPIEIKARELEGRTLLALEAASRGHQVVLGAKSDTIGLAEKGILQPGIVHDKSVTPNKKKIKRFDLLIEKKNLITSQDEEAGLVDETYERFARNRYSQETLALVDKIFCWGELEFSTLSNLYESYMHKFCKTGSPRVDVWASRLKDNNSPGSIFKQKKGDYILISSNFGFILNENRFWNIIANSRSNTNTELDDELIKFQRASWQHQLLSEFIHLIRILARTYPEINIVVRPHPVESIHAWPALIGDFTNVHVLREGSITSWVQNADAVIHNGCTTALEASIMRKPVIAFRPVPSEHERIIPNQISKELSNPCEVITHLNKILSDEKHIDKLMQQEVDSVIEHRFANYPVTGAYKKIVDEWEQFDIPSLNYKNKWEEIVENKSGSKEYDLYEKIKNRLKSSRQSSNKTKNHKSGINKNSTFTADHKFDKLEKSELERYKNLYSELITDVENISIKKFGHKSFVITK